MEQPHQLGVTKLRLKKTGVRTPFSKREIYEQFLTWPPECTVAVFISFSLLLCNVRTPLDERENTLCPIKIRKRWLGIFEGANINFFTHIFFELHYSRYLV